MAWTHKLEKGEVITVTVPCKIEVDPKRPRSVTIRGENGEKQIIKLQRSQRIRLTRNRRRR